MNSKTLQYIALALAAVNAYLMWRQLNVEGSENHAQSGQAAQL